MHDFEMKMEKYGQVITDRLFEAVISIASLKHLLDNILHLRVDDYLLGRIICSRITTTSEYTRAFACCLFLLQPQRFVFVYALG